MLEGASASFGLIGCDGKIDVSAIDCHVTGRDIRRSVRMKNVFERFVHLKHNNIDFDPKFSPFFQRSRIQSSGINRDE